MRELKYEKLGDMMPFYPRSTLVIRKQFVDAAIAELKDDKAQAEDDAAYWRKQYDEETKLTAALKDDIAELKAKLEDVQATAYAESVDACMRERKLKRAMWLARVDRADDSARIFYFNDLETKLDIDGFSYDPKKKKGCKKLTARLWRIIWLKVERKCRAKAEEYK